MNYIDTVREMIYSLNTDVERYTHGDKSDYIYCEEITKDYGSQDKNYTNRTRLCYGLIYDICKISNIEDIIRELFAEEVQSRKKDSFQGVGINLILLTVMLRKYESADSQLFEDAKNANFDCYCGYEYETQIYKFTPIEEISLIDAIYLASDMGMTDYLCRFVDEFKENISCIEDWKKLKYFATLTERMCDRKPAVTNIFDYALQNYERESFDFFFAVDNYIELLTDIHESEKASEIFLYYADIFREHKRSGYENGMRLIRDYPPCKENVWEVILPLIKADFKNIAPMNCIPLAECADIMGNKSLGRKLRKLHDRKMKY